MPNFNRYDPIQASLMRIEENLVKLHSREPKDSTASLWEVAGHIWGGAYWVGELTKNPEILKQVFELREELSCVVLKKHSVSTNAIGFESSIRKINGCFEKIKGLV